MQYAVVSSVRVEASPGLIGQCPMCEGQVVARCGEINAWHWAHRSRVDCDSFAEGEGRWHIDWKKRFPKQWREVTVGPHRADLKSPQCVIELQASSISTDELAEREQFYKEMVWVVDAREFDLHLRDHGNYVTFRWKHPRKTWWSAEMPLFFDIGGRLLKVHRVYSETPCGGSGSYLSYEEFVARFSRAKAGQTLCEDCRMPFPSRELIETGMFEYCTLDVDPGTMLCMCCRDNRCVERTSDDPSLWDCYTPLAVVT